MKNLKGYVNIKTDLDLIRININRIEEKEKTLKLEKDIYLELENKYSNLLAKMEEKLKDCKGIDRELLYEIMIKGTNVTRAVDKVAINYDMDSSTIWKNYYPKVKKQIDNLYLLLSEEKQIEKGD